MTTKPHGQTPWSPLLTDFQVQISSPHASPHITENAGYLCEILTVTAEVIDQL